MKTIGALSCEFVATMPRLSLKDSNPAVPNTLVASARRALLLASRYLRMIEESGRPLEGQEAGKEEKSYRSSISAGNGKSIEERITEIVSTSVNLGLNLDLLPQYFDISVIGLNKVGGRDAFEYLCTPRTDIKPMNADKAGTQFSLRVWVDANDLAFSQVQAQLLADHNRILSGTTASISWVPAEGV